MGTPTVYIADNMCTIYKLVLHKVQDTLLGMGYGITDSLTEADLCLVGLCASFRADEARSETIVRRALRAGVPAYGYGCLVSVRPDRFRDFLDFPVFPSWDPGGLIRAATGDESVLWTWRGIPNDFRTAEDYRVQDPTRKFVGISLGCNFECSYCPHKVGTGPLVSVPRTEVLSQVKRLVEAGTRTIVLTGTDTACYGGDLRSSFAYLLADILAIINPDTRLHIAQFNPQGLFWGRRYAEDTLDLLSDSRVADIQLPVQTASARLLDLMKRRYDPRAVAGFVDRLRERNPDVFLRTDLMVGFPTETMAELSASIEYACAHFDEVAVYAFEMKDVCPVSGMGLRGLSASEITRRRTYAVDAIRKRGLLAHSGGQVVHTLFENDRAKAAMRGTEETSHAE